MCRNRRMRRLGQSLAWLLAALPLAAAAGVPLQFAWQPTGTAAVGWTLDAARPLTAATARAVPAEQDTPLGSV